jgi:hypothetical protein
LYDAIHAGLNGEAWYELPVGTQIPPGLAIREDHKDPLFDVVPYTITSCHKMTLKAFTDLLDLFGKTARPRFDCKASQR